MSDARDKFLDLVNDAVGITLIVAVIIGALIWMGVLL